MSELLIRNDDAPRREGPPDYMLPGATAREVLDLLIGRFGAPALAQGAVTRDGTVVLTVRDVTITIAPTPDGPR